MAKIPETLANTPLHRWLTEKGGLTLFNRGKVRDTYNLPGYPDLLLVVATDHLSIFDFVLPCLVPNKGKILTTLTVFWLKTVLGLGDTPSHFIADKKEVRIFLANTIKADTRFLIVKKLDMLRVECIVREYLTGSAWNSYQKDGTAYGYKLPPLLHDGSRLPEPLFTPTTKAESGHDLPLTPEEVEKQYPGLRGMSLKIYEQACEYAFSRGIIVADTKFEFGKDKDGNLVLADEVLTPDSSRFWDKTEWQRAAQNGKAPTGYDKEPARKWGKTVKTPWGLGINNLDPGNKEHLAFVAQLTVPEAVIQDTTRRYQEVLNRLTR